MQITHEEAHTLIQFNADGALNAQEKSMLSAHLKDCSACSLYAEEISEVESILVPVMQKQWSLSPVPLSIRALWAEKSSKISTNAILATRRAAISIIFLVLLFSAWQFALSGRQESNPLPVSNVLPVPTPSTQFISTKIATQANCTEIHYVVQKNDTLESIAHQFSVSKEELMAVNGMKTEAVRPAIGLIIPICTFTPTSTVTLFSTTYTPSISPITSTPSG